MARPFPNNLGAGAAAILALLFVVFMLSVVGAGGRHGGDEALYTDAALRMMLSGDFITPRTADGAVRFQKPVLTYWLVAGSWKAFGINYFAARLPFVLALGGVLLATYRLSLTLFGSSAAAVAASALLIGNHNIIYAAERAVPDGPLTLFATLALLGFAGLLFRPGPAGAGTASEPMDRLLAWIGSGLAVATKGLVGVLLPMYGVAFAWLRRRHTGIAPGRLFGVMSTVAGLCLALGWFVLMAVRHGDGALRGFFFDQVGTRLGPGAGVVLTTLAGNIPAYLFTVVSDFLPWTLLLGILVAAEPARTRRFLRANREAWLFIAGWFTLLLVIFASGNLTRPRYLLPAYPLLAAGAGSLLTELLAADRPQRVLGWLARPARFFSLLPGLVLLAAGVRIDWRLALGGLAWFVATLLLDRFGRRPWPAPAVAIGAWMLIAFGIYDGPVRAVFSPAPGERMAEILAEDRVNSGRLAAVGVPDRVLAQLHVHSAGRAWPEVPAGAELPRDTDAVLLGPGAAASYAAAGYRIEPAGHEYRPFGTRAILDLLRADDQQAIYARQRIQYFIAFPPPS